MVTKEGWSLVRGTQNEKVVLKFAISGHKRGKVFNRGVIFEGDHCIKKYIRVCIQSRGPDWLGEPWYKDPTS